MAARIFPIVLLIAFLSTTTAAEETARVTMSGIGSMSCAHWQSSRSKYAEGVVWLYGFWTGLNYAAAVQQLTQSELDSSSIAKEVAKTCALSPSTTLAQAAWQTFATRRGEQPH
jgi:hypothetical protein